MCSSERVVRRGVARFVFGFVLVGSLLLSLSKTEFYERTILGTTLTVTAQSAAMVLRVAGEGARADGNKLISPRFGVRIGSGCDGLGPYALFASAVSFAPMLFTLRMIGLLAGAVFLFAVNQVRVISLYYAGIHAPGAFEMLHHEIWQALFILATIGTWLLWAYWAIRTERARA